MTRINRPDTLLTELRDLKRRLRLLEAGRMRPTGTTVAAASQPFGSPLSPASRSPAPPVPLVPTRPVDWPATTSADWERLAVTQATSEGTITLTAVADPGTAGEVRVVVNGSPGEAVPVTGIRLEHTTTTSGAGEIAVEVRRTTGTGLVRVIAVFHVT
jgi:hypothetical protein